MRLRGLDWIQMVIWWNNFAWNIFSLPDEMSVFHTVVWPAADCSSHSSPPSDCLPPDTDHWSSSCPSWSGWSPASADTRQASPPPPDYTWLKIDNNFTRFRALELTSFSVLAMRAINPSLYCISIGQEVLVTNKRKLLANLKCGGRIALSI